MTELNDIKLDMICESMIDAETRARELSLCVDAEYAYQIAKMKLINDEHAGFINQTFSRDHLRSKVQIAYDETLEKAIHA